ncbi:potassium/proton antiporter [Myxococcus sp. MISCRS1]|jgi:cell volume regulation protein A|uniref:potassium/proton antiporter n=1 Tax=Myxococcus TaxID=32 RepID=UPI001CBFF2A7|nr:MULTISPECIES: potassium/proton antiporter [unclassified Myxococcus]MBZ4398630.1 potassium/proton antiporter [Myxococcus sp. AS-1-15]MBZ4414426.1 potassium/proton antiporter [Myxococcus sp. XM-1-1-1]MCY1000306.1 potassium/proton antiporter [Myxococcus sp. MISCRS1]
MPITTEPLPTAFLLAVCGALLALSVLFSRASGRFGIPVALLFLGVGMAAGSDGPGGIAFDNYGFAFRLGTVALVLILFDGGLNTPLAAIHSALKPAAVLATVGVVATAALMGAAAHFIFGFGWTQSLLLGAIVSSTDAAAVFSVLRGSGLHLKRRVGTTLELESGLNDPMAVILTTGLTHTLASGKPPGWDLAVEAVVQMVVGAGLGLAMGMGARLLLKRLRLRVAGLYPVMTLALALLSFGLPTLLHGSGFLAVYVVGIALGNESIRYRTGLLRVHDALAWLSQVLMFLVLGLLVYPRNLVEVAWEGLGLGLVLAFLARPLAVFLCLLPFRFPFGEMVYTGWVGLRGAVPIILATFPVLANAPGSRDIFNIVFFIVVVNGLIPGATVPWVTKKLGLAANVPEPPQAVLEIASTQLLKGELSSFYIDKASAVAGERLADLPFPPGSAAMLLVRGQELLAPKGDTVFQPGDHVYVFGHAEDLPLLRLLFGQQEDE